MKFLHTADWHLGNQMKNISRIDEQKNFLAFLKEKIDEEKISTLLVSGDIFDIVSPSNEAKKIYYNFLSSLNNGPCKNVVITGGNHDSSSLLDASKELLENLNIHVIGTISSLKCEDLVFELYDENNCVEGICCAVPYVRESELRNFLVQEDSAGIEKKGFAQEAYKKLYDEVLSCAKKIRGERNIPIVATGHLYTSGLEGRLSNALSTESTDDGVKVLDVVGNLGNIDSNIFSNEFDYVALGHIHYTTTVDKNPKIRYSGSPFILGFDECNIPRTMLCVEAEKGCEPKVEKIIVPSFYEFRRIHGSIDEVKTEFEKICSQSFEKKTFFEVMYENELNRNIQLEFEEIIGNLNGNAEIISWKTKRKEEKKKAEGFESIDSYEISDLKGEEIFTRLIQIKSKEEDLDSEECIKEYLPRFMKIMSEEENENS